MLKKVRALYETNPMLGHRGVRLGITFPEIYEMQIRAILEAAAECDRMGMEVHPKIKVPQVCTAQELLYVKQIVDRVSKEVEQDLGHGIQFQFGTMIEVVRACMRADSLAEEADFFSFGTNDLTQATFLLLPGGRREQVPAPLQRARHPPGQPLRRSRPQGGGQAHGTDGAVGPGAAARPHRGHLRRARRPPPTPSTSATIRAGLRLLLGATYPRGAPGGGPCGAAGKASVMLA